jgi:hypothetical protein
MPRAVSIFLAAREGGALSNIPRVRAGEMNGRGSLPKGPRHR